MIPVERGSAAKPVFVALSTAKPNLKDSILMMAVTILPVAIVILMQKPALRQALVMRVNHVGKQFCHMQADWWNKAGDSFATQYNKAKM